MRKLIPTVAAAAATILLLAGCTSGPTAAATMLEKAVSIQPSSGDPKPVATATSVAVGETVKADKAGLSEVVFADKSYTRVGPSSELTIVELSTAEAQRTVTSLDVGESWHRVKKLTAEDGTYQVKTPVGTASVRGTAFAVTCDSDTECKFTVIEGQVSVKDKEGTEYTIDPFEQLTIPGDVLPFPIDAVKGDKWIMKNLELDGVQLAEVAEAAGTEDWQAATAGGWHLVYTVVSDTYSRGQDAIGVVNETDWTMNYGDCTDTGCTASVTSSGGTDFDVVINGEGMTWSNKAEAQCVNLETGEMKAEYGFDQAVTTTLTPTTVETVDGVPTVTAFEGTRTIRTTLRSPPDPNCTDSDEPDTTRTISVTATRTDG
ncbi:hypothetical protein ASF62_02670 [Leifsonia sp. Leaf325]|nr:FecR family protein [Leifsonia sp. Leaf325]KQQ95448.1 hypothetical protein ASF62_02670 [Leifsonia sp. Leaf325]